MIVMTVAAEDKTPEPTPAVTITKSRKHHKSKAAEVTITVTEDIYLDCDQSGNCTPTATKFSGPKETPAKVSSRKHRHATGTKKGRKTKAPEDKPAPTPCDD